MADQTPARLNSLVEYPNGTAVLAVKPPGSTVEIEIKQVGRRRDRPLDVVFARDGRPVPVSHRLDGGSVEHSLQWEASQVARLTKIYREIHGVDPPISHIVCLNYINAVPTGPQTTAHIIEYFQLLLESRDANHPGTKCELERAIAAYSQERPDVGPVLEGEIGLIVRFIEHTSPTQAVLVGTSSVRLDRLAQYLSPDGFSQYIKELPGPKGTRLGAAPEEARRFADTLLEEVLGTYRPPETRSPNYARYVAAALSAPQNRARADRVHVALAEQLGAFWGTLLGIKVFTNGESFVARNVGIKRSWRQGRWQVSLIFMDHDDLHFADQVAASFHPGRVIPGMMRDETHTAFDARGRPGPVTILDHLGAIYRSDAPTCRRAKAAMRRTMRRAYRKVQNHWRADLSLGGAFSHAFGNASRAWDRAVAAYVVHRERGSGDAAWQRAVMKVLRRAGVECSNFDLYLESLVQFSPFLERHAFLYRGERPGEPKQERAPSTENETAGQGCASPCPENRDSRLERAGRGAPPSARSGRRRSIRGR